MPKRLLDRDNRSLKERLVDFAKGSDNFSRMGTKKKRAKKKKLRRAGKKKAKKVKHI